ncbi:MAG: glycosyltransferase [Chloroflexota bacterium]|nr:MAG: glycosyl transferase [Chloroflexota bacterium]
MKILMVTHELPTPAHPGTMAPVARQIQSLQACGLEIDVLQLHGVRKLKYLPALIEFQRRVAHADLVHAHFGYCAWLALSQHTKPLVISFMGDDLLGEPDEHGHIQPLSKLVVQINRWVAKHADAVIVKSAEMAQIVAPVAANIIPNGVDIQTFRPVDRSQARASLGWPDDRHYVLFAGNPAYARKGYPLAQSTMEHLRRCFDRPVELRSLWNVSPDQVPLYMNASDALLMVSLIEGSPNVVKEALACNLPVVSVPVGDVAYVLEGVDTGGVFPRDPETLAGALKAVLSSGKRSNGRTILLQKGLDLASVAERIVRIYDGVLRTKSQHMMPRTS